MKNKFLRSIAVIALALIMGTSMVGCGGDTVADTEDNLVIEAFLAGYGVEFLNKTARKFEEIYPGKTVSVLESISLMQPELDMKLKAGPKFTATDLFFGGSLNPNYFVAKGKDIVKGYDCVLEDLSDVYDSKPYGEDILIKDKIFPEHLEYVTYSDGKKYSMPWGAGANGLVYHADVFKEKGWKVPTTTDQLIELCSTIKQGGWVPLTWNKYGYWTYATTAWWAQYEGIDAYKNFFKAKIDGEYTHELFAQAGRLESLTVLENLIADKNGNSYSGSITLNHTDSQMYFLDKDTYKIAMLPNGDWLEGEMSQNFPTGSVNMEMMKNPVISSIIDNLPTGKNTAVTTDEKLQEVIAEVDAGLSGLDGVDEKDFARIKEARNITYSSGFDHQAVIPVYANAKPLAKDFLRLLYSDIGNQIYLENTRSILPIKSDVVTKKENVDKMTSFQKSALELSNGIGVSRKYYFDPLFSLANLEPYTTVSPEILIGGIGVDAVSADKFFTDQYTWVESRFSEYKTNAGIRD